MNNYYTTIFNGIASCQLRDTVTKLIAWSQLQLSSMVTAERCYFPRRDNLQAETSTLEKVSFSNKDEGTSPTV